MKHKKCNFSATVYLTTKIFPGRYFKANHFEKTEQEGWAVQKCSRVGGSQKLRMPNLTYRLNPYIQKMFWGV